MAGFLDFLHSAMNGAGAAAPAAQTASGPGSAADPFKPLPTMPQGGFLQGIDPTKLGQAGMGMQDTPDAANPGQSVLEQLMQMQARRQQMAQQLLGGR